jgi:hypothetical protein
MDAKHQIGTNSEFSQAGSPGNAKKNDCDYGSLEWASKSCPIVMFECQIKSWLVHVI